MNKIIARYPPQPDLPPLWGNWSDCVRDGHEPADIGLKCQQSALNRFSARYRVARAFDGVSIRGFSPATVDGYGALFRLFLAWSAFEQYLKALQCKQADCTRLIGRYLTFDLVEQIRSIDAGDRFFHLVINKAKGDQVDELEKYLRHDRFNHSYLASSVRHIFAHGLLTPNANGATPEAVADICNILSDAHLDAAGDDFRRRVRLLLDQPLEPSF